MVERHMVEQQRQLEHSRGGGALILRQHGKGHQSNLKAASETKRVLRKSQVGGVEELRIKKMEEPKVVSLKQNFAVSRSGGLEQTAGNGLSHSPGQVSSGDEAVGKPRRRKRDEVMETVPSGIAKRRQRGPQDRVVAVASPAGPAAVAPSSPQRPSGSLPIMDVGANAGGGVVQTCSTEGRSQPSGVGCEAALQAEAASSMPPLVEAAAKQSSEHTTVNNVTLPVRKVRTTVTRSKPSKRSAPAVSQRQSMASKSKASHKGLKHVDTSRLSPESVLPFVQELQATPLVLSRGRKAQAPKAWYMAPVVHPEQPAQNWYLPPYHMMPPPVGILAHPPVMPVGLPYGSLPMGLASHGDHPGVLSEPGASFQDSYAGHPPFLRASYSSAHINELVAKYSQSPLDQDLWSPRWSAKAAHWMEDPGPCELSRCQDVLEFLEEVGEGQSDEVDEVGARQDSTGDSWLVGAWTRPDQARQKRGLGAVQVCLDLPGPSEAAHAHRGYLEGFPTSAREHARGGMSQEVTAGKAASLSGEGICMVAPGVGERCPGSALDNRTIGEVPPSEGGRVRGEPGRRLESLLDMADLDVAEAQVSDWLLDTPGGDDWVADDWLTDGDFGGADAEENEYSQAKPLVRIGTNESSTGGSKPASKSSSSATEVEQEQDTPGLEGEMVEGMGEGTGEGREAEEPIGKRHLEPSAGHKLTSLTELPDEWWKVEENHGVVAVDKFGLPDWSTGEEGLSFPLV